MLAPDKCSQMQPNANSMKSSHIFSITASWSYIVCLGGCGKHYTELTLLCTGFQASRHDQERLQTKSLSEAQPFALAEEEIFQVAIPFP